MVEDIVKAKPAWRSKINVTQVIAMVAAVSAYLGGPELDAQTQAAILVLIPVVQGSVTAIFRTWFNNTVSPELAGKTVYVQKA